MEIRTFTLCSLQVVRILAGFSHGVVLTKLTSMVSFLLYPPSFSLILKALGYVFLFNNDNFDNFLCLFLKEKKIHFGPVHCSVTKRRPC